MGFTIEEYKKLADRLNALPFTDQVQRVIDNPEILECTITFKFKNVPEKLQDEVGDILVLNIKDINKK